MYSKDSFRSPALQYYYGTKVKQEDILFMQIQEIAGSLGDVITSTVVAVASVQQKMQQAATELREL